MIAHDVEIFFGWQRSKIYEGVEVYERFYKRTSEKIVTFRDARNWKQFHNPKDLAISISLEAAELLEVFQWSGADNEVDTDKKLKKVRESQLERNCQKKRALLARMNAWLKYSSLKRIYRRSWDKLGQHRIDNTT